MIESRWRSEILGHLERHAIYPKAGTDPTMVRDYLKALYTMEVRIMRAEQQKMERAGDSSGRKEYARKVIELRNRYPALRIPVEWWTQGSENE